MATLETMFGAGEVETFLGLPRWRDLSRLEADIALIGAGMATPYSSVGPYCRNGPGAIRAASAAYAANLGHVNFDLGGPVLPEGVHAVDAGDLPQAEDDIEGNRARIFGAISQVLDRRGVPVLIGGDDSVQIPMLEAYGARGRPVTILQIDAHIDWRDEVGGERMGLSSTMRRAAEMDHVEQIVQVGARGIGSARGGDWADARRAGVEFVMAGEIARHGVGRAVDLVPEGGEVVVCFDLDGMDPAVMPAVIGRTAGGLSYWQVLELIGGAAERGRIAGVGFVEFMPERDVDGIGALTAAQCLTSILGIVARQR
ncbi:MAG: arginase family protein [Rhodobacteraceae bacterium]|nr:arginase family protein [Paracoccaceae bacterium]